MVPKIQVRVIDINHGLISTVATLDVSALPDLQAALAGSYLQHALDIFHNVVVTVSKFQQVPSLPDLKSQCSSAPRGEADTNQVYCMLPTPVACLIASLTADFQCQKACPYTLDQASTGQVCASCCEPQAAPGCLTAASAYPPGTINGCGGQNGTKDSTLLVQSRIRVICM